MSDTPHRVKARSDAFASIAFWELMSFILMICFVWGFEFIDLPHHLFGTEPSPFNLYRASILTAAIIVAAIVCVGHTYERQQRLVKRLLMTCLYCHRVKTDGGEWQHVEEYFMRHFPVAIDREACPECQSMLDSIDTGQLEKTQGAPTPA